MGIRINLLPTMMISKMEINDQKFIYEDYLLELVNFSGFFKGLTGGEQFTKIVEQDHGQADVRTSNYELDFKLLVNEEFVNKKLKSLPNRDYSHLQDGYIFLNDKKSGESITQPKAHSEFVKFFCKLMNITNEQIVDGEKDKNNEFYSIIKMMKKQKNLLFFLPFEIECDTDIEALNTVARIKNIFSLRDSINKDTFIVVLRKEDGTLDEFYIIKYDKGGFEIVDKVNKLFVPLFYELYRVTSITENR